MELYLSYITYILIVWNDLKLTKSKVTEQLEIRCHTERF